MAQYTRISYRLGNLCHIKSLNHASDQVPPPVWNHNPHQHHHHLKSSLTRNLISQVKQLWRSNYHIRSFEIVLFHGVLIPVHIHSTLYTYTVHCRYRVIRFIIGENWFKNYAPAIIYRSGLSRHIFFGLSSRSAYFTKYCSFERL